MASSDSDSDTAPDSPTYVVDKLLYYEPDEDDPSVDWYVVKWAPQDNGEPWPPGEDITWEKADGIGKGFITEFKNCTAREKKIRKDEYWAAAEAEEARKKAEEKARKTAGRRATEAAATSSKRRSDTTMGKRPKSPTAIEAAKKLKKQRHKQKSAGFNLLFDDNDLFDSGSSTKPIKKDDSSDSEDDTPILARTTKPPTAAKRPLPALSSSSSSTTDDDDAVSSTTPNASHMTQLQLTSSATKPSSQSASSKTTTMAKSNSSGQSVAVNGFAKGFAKTAKTGGAKLVRLASTSSSNSRNSADESQKAKVFSHMTSNHSGQSASTDNEVTSSGVHSKITEKLNAKMQRKASLPTLQVSVSRVSAGTEINQSASSPGTAAGTSRDRGPQGAGSSPGFAAVTTHLSLTTKEQPAPSAKRINDTGVFTFDLEGTNGSDQSPHASPNSSGTHENELLASNGELSSPLGEQLASMHLSEEERNEMAVMLNGFADLVEVCREQRRESRNLFDQLAPKNSAEFLDIPLDFTEFGQLEHFGMNYPRRLQDHYAEQLETSGNSMDQNERFAGAVKSGNIDAMRREFESGNGVIDVNQPDKYRLTLLAYCALMQLKQPDDRFNRIAELLTAYGADVNATTKSGFTPLMIACKAGVVGFTQGLLKCARVKLETALPSNGDTALVLATRKGHVAIVELLLAAGANINCENRSGETCFTIAAKAKNDALLKLLTDFRDGIQRAFMDQISMVCGSQLLLEHCVTPVQCFSLRGADGLFNSTRFQYGKTPKFPLPLTDSTDRPLPAEARLLLFTGVAEISRYTEDKLEIKNCRLNLKESDWPHPIEKIVLNSRDALQPMTVDKSHSICLLDSLKTGVGDWNKLELYVKKDLQELTKDTVLLVQAWACTRAAAPDDN